MELKLRLAQTSDIKELQELFVNTIESVCNQDYDPIQRRAWTSSVENTERWTSIISDQLVIVAEIQRKIVGFITLKDGVHIDLLYVHKDFQRKGIAQLLYDEIELKADSNILTADVSITARPFFERNGFKVIQRQIVKRKDSSLVNFKMNKYLNRN